MVRKTRHTLSLWRLALLSRKFLLIVYKLHLEFTDNHFFILRIIYFMAVSLTAGSFVAERRQGLLDRSLVAGKP